jgi:hypothetical protein
VALGVVALLATNVSWAASTKPKGKKETVTVKTVDGRTFTADLDTSNSVIIPASKLKLLYQIPIKGKQKAPGGVKSVDPSALYSNVTNYSGSVINPGSASTYDGGTNVRTIFLGDDTTLTFASTLNGAKFCISNSNTTPTQGVFQTFHYDNTGAGGGPGQRMLATGPGWGFAAGNELAPETISCYYSDISANGYAATMTGMWTLVAFQDSSGAYTVTPAEMNNLGIGIFTGPDMGSSTDNYFTASAVGGAVANIAGTIGVLGAATENFGLEWTELPPVPVTLQMFTAD